MLAVCQNFTFQNFLQQVYSIQFKPQEVTDMVGVWLPWCMPGLYVAWGRNFYFYDSCVLTGLAFSAGP